jgi:hypothetical protein
MVRASAVSHPVVRPTNEGRYLCKEDLCPFAVAEGISGRTAIHLANRPLFRASEAHDDYMGTGTTVVSALEQTIT